MSDSSGTLAQSPGPAKVFAARFDKRDDADATRSKLQALGYDPKEISYISDPEKCAFAFDGSGGQVGTSAAKGALGGVALGGGMSAAFVALGLGSVVFLGPIGVVAGVAVGGLVGVLVGAGLDSDQALACEKAVREGSLVMSVQAHAGDDERVGALLGDRVIATQDDIYR